MNDLTLNGGAQSEVTLAEREHFLDEMLAIRDRYGDPAKLTPEDRNVARTELSARLSWMADKHISLEDFHRETRFIELEWRAELLAQQPPQHGGDRSTKNWKARQLFGTPKRKVKTAEYRAIAGKKATVIGALKNAGVMKRKKNPHQDAPKKRTRESSSHTAEQTRNFIAAIVKLADGQSHPLNHIAGSRTLPRLVSTIHCLRAVRLIPWITLEHPDAEHVIVQVDQKLRDYIDDYRAGEKVPEVRPVAARTRGTEFSELRPVPGRQALNCGH